ncbi:MAG: hypothetical protein HY335_07200 [Deinococcus sp.]|nr:hypothetical protein [Deinococcus sp.]
MVRGRLWVVLALVVVLAGYGGWRLFKRPLPAVQATPQAPLRQFQLSQRDLSQVVARARQQAQQAGGYGTIIQQSAEAARAEPAVVTLSTAQATQAQDLALVQIRGTVTQVSDGLFTVDDGSGPVMVEMAPGLDVAASGLAAGRQVTVVGAASGGRLAMRDQADLQLP